MPRCSVVLKYVTLLRGVGGCNAPSFNPTNTVAFFNTTEQRGILQQNEAA
jgi:hypothetical protein